jgi:hypothetical protein
MMLPPDDSDDPTQVTYDLPRGTCHRCGGEAIRHLVIGLPAGPAAINMTPAWVDWIGCVHPGYDRECDDCGFTWAASYPSEQLPTPTAR